MNVLLRAGICGVNSFYSGAFFRACRSNPHLEAVACTHQPDDSKPPSGKSGEEFGSEHGLKAYASVAEMVAAENLQVVFVASADNVKATHAAAAARAGSHVFISKPMCLTLADADLMLAARDEKSVNISALMPGRYDGAIRSVYNEVAKGAIGDVLTTRAWIQHGCFGPGTVFEGLPEFAPGQGGIELSLGFYAADLILWMMPSTPVRAFAEYDNLGTPHSIWMDTGKGIVRFGDGRMASMDIIYNVQCGAPPWEIEVVGTKGIARAHLDVMEGIIWQGGQGPRVLYRNQNDVIGAAVESFVTSCLEGTTPEVTVEHGRNVLELSLAWKESARAQQPVSLPLGI